MNVSRGAPFVLLAIILLASVTVSQQPRRIDDNVLRNAGKSGNEWLTYGLTQAEMRFSPLNQINAGNVSRLGLAWSYDTGVGGGGQEATPLVWNGTIYGITNWSVVFAVDAVTGKERWRWDPEVNQTAVRPKICCGVVNRGLAIYQGMIIAPVIDGRLQAHDVETGRILWEARVAFPQDGYTITMAPRIAKGKVIVGVSGGDRPTRGYFSAYDALTGRLAWRFYTVPGDPSKPFENAAMRKAAETWDGDWWKFGGGGAVWDGMAYDSDTALVYVGTGNAEPWPEQLRHSDGKDNLYVCSILAVNVDTGELKWHYQMVPGDSWDYDSVQQMILADLNINGRARKVIMQANKNGFYYVIDRITGAFISAQPFSQVTWAKGIDQETGRPMVNPEAHYGTDAITISPGGGGAHNWSPMSFNPIAGLVYIPTSTANSFTYAMEKDFSPQPGRTTGTVRPVPVPARPAPPAIGPAPVDGPGNRGALTAWDPVAQKMRWRAAGGGGIGGGTVTTAGNLVFQTINDGRLVAYAADKGEKLLDIQTGLRSGMGPPITYRVGGRQYVALMGGVGDVAAGGAGPGNTATPFVPKLLTFVLDGQSPSPSARGRSEGLDTR
ncbi:MAG TPA: PQQ-dependent dehydrogenase, methanol/ethanol family [Terriglobia bacterium]|nr:PQQ-dependent dehydrogenase, methanol/ethanol family [Terriglobia bacterium]